MFFKDNFLDICLFCYFSAWKPYFDNNLFDEYGLSGLFDLLFAGCDAEIGIVVPGAPLFLMFPIGFM